ARALDPQPISYSDVRKRSEYQLASVFGKADATAVREVAQRSNALVNSWRHAPGGSGIVLSDVFDYMRDRLRLWLSNGRALRAEQIFNRAPYLDGLKKRASYSSMRSTASSTSWALALPGARRKLLKAGL